MRVTLFLACVLACTSNVGEPPPLPAECEDTTPLLELGACVDATGAPCSLAEGEEPFFQAMGDEDSLSVVFGPQGSSMFVIAARARDITPGDLDDPLGSGSPLVELDVTDQSGERLSLLRRRSAFSPVADDEGLFFNSGFFVVVDGSCPRGEVLHAHGTLLDQTGAMRCGDLTFRVDCP